MLVQYAIFDVNVLVPARFLMKVSCRYYFSNYDFRVGIRKISQQLILFQIIDIDPHFSYMKK